jgi:hypothetical protein
MVVKGTGEEMLHGADMDVVSVVVGTNFKEEEFTHMKLVAAERRVKLVTNQTQVVGAFRSQTYHTTL